MIFDQSEHHLVRYKRERKCHFAHPLSVPKQALLFRVRHQALLLPMCQGLAPIALDHPHGLSIFFAASHQFPSAQSWQHC